MSRHADKVALSARLLRWRPARLRVGALRHRRGTIEDFRRDQQRVRVPGMTTSVALAGAGLSIGVVIGMSLAGQMRPVAQVSDMRNPVAQTPSLSKVVVPSWRITQPLNLPSRVNLVESSTVGPPAPIASELAKLGVPEVAMRAYQQAAEALSRSRPGCGLHWSQLAAIGRIETNHGSFGGARLRTDGTTTTIIRGPQLNGSPFARITDTDDGILDGDMEFDRAVGPMQFIPSTWRLVSRDGNGDGRADPHNIFDAALSAGVLLCSGDASLVNEAGLRAAALRYNHSNAYADLVAALARSYRADGAIVIEGSASVNLAPAASDPGRQLADAFTRGGEAAALVTAQGSDPMLSEPAETAASQPTSASPEGSITESDGAGVATSVIGSPEPSTTTPDPADLPSSTTETTTSEPGLVGVLTSVISDLGVLPN